MLNDAWAMLNYSKKIRNIQLSSITSMLFIFPHQIFLNYLWESEPLSSSPILWDRETWIRYGKKYFCKIWLRILPIYSNRMTHCPLVDWETCSIEASWIKKTGTITYVLGEWFINFFFTYEFLPNFADTSTVAH